ncbi:hypothetical protein F8M41_005338 [Gigaspora margarita]|uniref:Uncharacterized protein n=1 Tax=Gigaspora margarita TaxID=4874 RepID=A0A8H3X9U5_GIGMA|nr:hypothetical protein F8M41_005338 [Gigaspora margarita]
MELIKEILNSNLKSPTYYLIIGPDDCGKSTLVNFVVKTFGKGIIYVEGGYIYIQEFGENFAKAINYAKLDVNLVEWLMNKLSVVDSLQDIAKTDHRLFTVIFIARDVDNFINNSSFNSYCITLYIGDFNKNEALSYLVNNRNI